uniref:N-acetylneuraminate lyase n=1 Tax=Paramormyrops kingsleyae TaxID=1676925 RepID=A0A3B3T2K9_9TELE
MVKTKSWSGLLLSGPDSLNSGCLFPTLSLLVNGTTGEGVSLCTEERKRLTEEWCRRGKGKLNQVIVHVGCYSLKDSQELARHAAEAGADGIAVIAPSFFKSATADGIRRFLQEIAAEAPTLPFYYYHIPAVTGLSLRARDVLEGIDALIPTFRGLKFSGSDLMDFGQCVSYAKPHWSLLYGVDEQLLAALSMGADGAVGSTFNYLGPLVSGLLTAYGKGDVSQARTLQLQMQEFLCPAVKQGECDRDRVARTPVWGVDSEGLGANLLGEPCSAEPCTAEPCSDEPCTAEPCSDKPCCAVHCLQVLTWP